MTWRDVGRAKIFKYAHQDSAQERSGETAESSNNCRGEGLHQHQITHLHLDRLHWADQDTCGGCQCAGQAENKRDENRDVDAHQVSDVLILRYGSDCQSDFGVFEEEMKQSHQRKRNHSG